MGSALMDGVDLVRLAERHGWVDVGGSKHPFLLKKLGNDPCPCATSCRIRTRSAASSNSLRFPGPNGRRSSPRRDLCNLAIFH